MADDAELPWEPTFVENATRARKTLRLSQTELAKRVAEKGLPFHQQTIQRIEQGSRPVRLNEAVVLADVLMMDDLIEAITPRSAEMANKALVEANREAMRGLGAVTKELQTLADTASELAQAVFTERSFYVRSSQALGYELTDVRAESEVRLSEALNRKWRNVAERLQSVIASMRWDAETTYVEEARDDD